jgi:hypothetical protein
MVSLSQSFNNLDFESAYDIPSAPGPQGWGVLPADQALPSWNTGAAWVQQNGQLIIGPAVILYGPSMWPVIHGLYSVGLQAGPVFPFNGGVVSESISQDGVVPMTATSLRMDVYSFNADIQISLNDQVLPMQPIFQGPNYETLATDISQFAGQEANLAITVLNGEGVFDSITFSPEAVPEPMTFTLAAVCAAIASLKRKR